MSRYEPEDLPAMNHASLKSCAHEVFVCGACEQESCWAHGLPIMAGRAEPGRVVKASESRVCTPCLDARGKGSGVGL